MTGHLRAVLWAQVRIYRNFLPRRGWGAVFGAGFTLLWYGFMAFLAWLLAAFTASPSSLELLQQGLPLALAGLTLYWQAAPVLAASAGASLELRRLLAWPIPHNQLFVLELLLRLPVSGEVLILLVGASIGMLLNPALPRAVVPLAMGCFIAFNLFLSAGVKNLLLELLERKRVRELLIFLFVIAMALPQVVAMKMERGYFEQLAAGASHFVWPWTSPARLVTGDLNWRNWLLVFGWVIASLAFGRWQFERSLFLEKHTAESVATLKAAAPRRRGGLVDRLAAVGLLFHDPLGALVERELRTWARTPRFRLLFFMGFTFSLLIWVPLAFFNPAGGGGWIQSNFLPFVGCYALLLISESVFFNIFGLDRSAAQMYFVAPVNFLRVLLAKNLAGLLAVVVQLVLITLVCLLFRLPLGLWDVVEAFAVVITTAVFMFAAGNLVSVYYARGINPEQAWGSSGSGKSALTITFLLPVLMLPAGISYLARFAFEQQAAFYVVLAIWLLIGLVVYGVATHSALEASLSRRDQFLDHLSHGAGPISN